MRKNIFRNQANREAFLLTPDKNIWYYFMPNGRMFMNRLNNESGSDYRAVSFKQLSKMKVPTADLKEMMGSWKDVIDEYEDNSSPYNWKVKSLRKQWDYAFVDDLGLTDNIPDWNDPEVKHEMKLERDYEEGRLG